WTLDWVPEGPRGFVRDLRLRWACEEAGLPYSVRTVPFEGRETNHLDRQPFGQVSFLSDGEPGDIRERRLSAASRQQERDADAGRSGGRSGNARMGDRRAQFDRDGDGALVVPRNIPVWRTTVSKAGSRSGSISSISSNRSCGSG